MRPTLLYIRGVPGSGKHTIGRIIADRLQWSYLWLHDVYKMPFADPIEIARSVIPALANQMREGKSIVFTRPSRLRSTVEAAAVLAGHCGYDFRVVRLTASRNTLLQRVTTRDRHDWRVSDSEGLDEYLRDGGPERYPGEKEVVNEAVSMEKAATLVIKAAGL